MIFGLRGLLWSVVFAVVAGTLCGGISGCNTQGCSDNRSALPLMGFYSNLTGARIVLDSIDMGGVGAPDDSLLIHSGQSVQSLYLPFRYDSNVTSFLFHYDYKLQGLDDPAFDDVITFRYTSEPYFASEECGAYYIYTIESVSYTRHLIDSVAILDSVITNVDMERIQVFFRISEPESPDEPDDSDESGNPDDSDSSGDSAGNDSDETVAHARHIKIGRTML